jgi:hypothetical protein
MTHISQEFRLSKKKKVPFLESVALREYPFLEHAFCTRWGGVSQEPFSNFNFSVQVGDRKGNIEQNREILASAFNIPHGGFLTVEQVHGDKIAVINNDVPGSQCYPGYDGIITNRKDLAVAIKTADCIPIFLVDTKERVIGVVHAGWRGTVKEIAARSVDIFTKKFSSSTSNIVAVLGPAIGPCCYEVDETFYNLMKEKKDYAAFFRKIDKKGKWTFDLNMANNYQLREAGLLQNHIVSAQICTSCNRGKFFSHRGEGGNTGRQINFLMIKQH